MSTGITTKHLPTVRAWASGQHPTTLDCCMNQRHQPVSTLTDGTSTPTQISSSQVLTRKARQTFFLESSCSYNISPPSKRHQDSRFLPTAIQWSTGTFARLIGSVFAFLQMNPLRDCHLWTHQILKGHTWVFVRAYYLGPNNVGLSHVAIGRSMCHTGTKSARPSIALSPKPQWGPTLIELLCPYYLGCSRRSRSNRRKLLIPSTSHTLATRCGEPSTNLLAGLDAPLTCAPSRQTSLTSKLWRTRHIGPRITSPQGWSTRSCPTYGRFQYLRVTVSLNPLGWRNLLLPSDVWNQESLRDRSPSSQSYAPRQVGSQILVLQFPHFQHAPIQNSKDLEKGTNSCDP